MRDAYKLVKVHLLAGMPEREREREGRKKYNCLDCHEATIRIIPREIE